MATTLSRTMKKAASSLIPLASRTPRRNYISAINTRNGANICRQVSRATLIPCSDQDNSADLANKISNPDKTLLSVLESFIVCAEDKVHKAPSDFPFKIEEDEERDSITLTREYQGEEIEVLVFQPNSSNSVQLDVSVSKKSKLTLKFKATAQATEGITINRFNLKTPDSYDAYDMIFPFDYGRPTFVDLEESLQNALYAYLQVRGITPNTGKFLCDYMVQKKHKRYFEWFKTFRKFIAE